MFKVCTKNIHSYVFPLNLSLVSHAVLFFLVFNLAFFNPKLAFAASSSWEQTDWSGGVGSDTDTEFSSSSNITYSTTGQLSLATISA